MRTLTRRTILATPAALAATRFAVATAQETAIPDSGAAIIVPVELKEFHITAGQTVFRTAQPYTFVVSNAGVIPHEFVIELRDSMDEAIERDGVKADMSDIMPGTTRTLDWTFDQPGQYKMSCHVPGHYEAGMDTPIDVVGNPPIEDVSAPQDGVAPTPVSAPTAQP
ncbi:MAG: plastocyanin/azurin family copper-binding protein [Thermomicrobiales bacterium]